MANDLSEMMALTCIGCRHCKLIRWHGSFSPGVPVKDISCKKGHRQLREEDLTMDCRVYSDTAHELYQEHLYLHSPHYGPEDGPEGELIMATKDGWAGGRGEGEAMLWRIDCPDWEGNR